jgi:hypothetical protein
MRFFSRRIELPDMVTVQRPHDANPGEHDGAAEIGDQHQHVNPPAIRAGRPLIWKRGLCNGEAALRFRRARAAGHRGHLDGRLVALDYLRPTITAEALWHKLHIDRKRWRLTICYELLSV